MRVPHSTCVASALILDWSASGLSCSSRNAVTSERILSASSFSLRATRPIPLITSLRCWLKVSNTPAKSFLALSSFSAALPVMKSAMAFSAASSGVRRAASRATRFLHPEDRPSRNRRRRRSKGRPTSPRPTSAAPWAAHTASPDRADRRRAQGSGSAAPIAQRAKTSAGNFIVCSRRRGSTPYCVLRLNGRRW